MNTKTQPDQGRSNIRAAHAPNRSEVNWTQFLLSQVAVARDFATIDTALLRRCYLLFFINTMTREVFYAGITAHPTGAWTTQAARNLFLRHRVRLDSTGALVRDSGSQFIDAFDEIFRTKGLNVLKTRSEHRSPLRSQNDGSERCGASHSIAHSSGTSDSSNASPATT